MAETIIRAEGLCMQTGKQFLLRDINWEVKRGEHWLIFGMNGSGKTTLLSMVAGFKCPTKGRLEVLVQTYSNDNIFALRRKIGWVSSSFFDIYLSREPALEIVLSGLSGTLGIRYGITAADVRQAKALLRELQLADKMNTPFCHMSKGERQNVLIARALIARPEILVLDEPSAGLDIYAREHMLNTVRDLAAHQNVTVLYVTHYPEEIQPFMNKTLLMRKGQVFAQGDTDSVVTSEYISRLMGDRTTVSRAADGRIRMGISAASRVRELCYSTGERG